MKIAVIKLGSRISFNANDTSGGNGEARSIIKMLELGGAEIHIFTKILAKDNLLPQHKWHDLKDQVASLHLISNETQEVFDALVVLNGNVNFFGGESDPEQLMNYTLINCFPGRVFYILCDPALTLKQVWPSVRNKPWGNEWSENALHITRTDIIYVSQPHDVQKVIKQLKKNDVKPENIIHYPFEQFPMLSKLVPFNSNPEVDLIYGGTMRGNRRVKKMVKYYFGHPENIKVEMFGKITLEDFEKSKVDISNLNAPTFSKAIRYDKFCEKINTSLAHCVIGDPWYEEINDIPQRVYESINSNVVTFIDSDLDKLRRVYGVDKELADVLYVSSREELSEKIAFLKNDVVTRLEIIKAQHKVVGFNGYEYCTGFIDQIKNFLNSDK